MVGSSPTFYMLIYCGKEEITKIAKASNQTLAIFFPISLQKLRLHGTAPNVGLANGA